MYAHHIIAITTYYQTLYFMDFMVVFGCMLMFMEISTPFMAFRWLFFRHGMHESKWYAASSAGLFLTFLFGRIFF